MTERISPISDLGFKKSLSSPESKDVLQGLIGDFFEIGRDIHYGLPEFCHRLFSSIYLFQKFLIGFDAVR